MVVLKDTALGTVILYPELLTSGKTLGSAYANTVPAYIVVAIIFIVINYSLTKVAGYLEGRMKRRQRSAGGALTQAMPGAPGGGGTMPSFGHRRQERSEPRPGQHRGGSRRIARTRTAEGPGPRGPGPSVMLPRVGFNHHVPLADPSDPTVPCRV